MQFVQRRQNAETQELACCLETEKHVTAVSSALGRCVPGPRPEHSIAALCASAACHDCSFMCSIFETSAPLADGQLINTDKSLRLTYACPTTTPDFAQCQKQCTIYLRVSAAIHKGGLENAHRMVTRKGMGVIDMRTDTDDKEHTIQHDTTSGHDCGIGHQKVLLTHVSIAMRSVPCYTHYYDNLLFKPLGVVPTAGSGAYQHNPMNRTAKTNVRGANAKAFLKPGIRWLSICLRGSLAPLKIYLSHMVTVGTVSKVS